MNNKGSSKQKLYTLQLLRGLAAVLVVLAHCDLIFSQNYGTGFFFRYFTFGGSGVDFFFVLSGFIMIYVHKNDIGKSQKLLPFFFKRFTRIYPIYWVFLTLKMAASFLFSYDPDSTTKNFIEVVKAFTLFPQDREILSSSFLGVSWTLSHEILFYVIFALLIGLSSRIAYTLISIWFVGVLVNFVGFIQFPKESIVLNFIFSPYNIEFAMGCLAAYFFFKYKIKWGMLLLSIGAFLYTLSAINYYYKIINFSQVITFGIPSVLLLLGFAYLEVTKNIQVPKLLVYLGDASYSIYLAHGFAINNLSKIVQRIYPKITENIFLLSITGIVIALLSIMFGCLVFSLIEKPLIFSFKPKKVVNA
ncbi:putative acetyltransferase [Nostoc sp. NIES-3756]|uniref:acyltransferase family protein n=1 Tax=Nostoc sp. NIES-3756 TaxID=1751286 RepID=UPI000721D78E|nr:acyltransferase [Nostoc sp. NIES-3756]BAT54328.1 putative acetyltransferase [Nostoc sp. NIES-3756]